MTFEGESVSGGESSGSEGSSGAESQLNLPLGDSGSDGSTSTSGVTAEKTAEAPKVEGSLRDKIEKKMAAAKANDAKAAAVTEAAESARKAAEPAKTDPKTPVLPAKTAPNANPETPAYAPNFKYKFTDDSQKQQEKEFPEWAKAGIKDPDSEKEIRTLFEKAGGLDFVLPRFKQTREELSALKPRLQSFDTNIADLKEKYAKGDMDSIWNKLGIAEEKVLQWAVERAKYYQLPPEQQRVIAAQKNAEMNAQHAEQHANSTEQRYQEQARQIKQLQLATVLQRTDVSNAEKSFDEKVGKKGAFFEQVKLHGETTWYRSNGKIDLTPEQAISQVMEMYGLNGAQAPNAGQPAPTTPPAAAAAPAAPARSAQPAVKVIPNVGSRANSPSSGNNRPRSIEDLRKIAKEMQN